MRKKEAGHGEGEVSSPALTITRRGRVAPQGLTWHPRGSGPRSVAKPGASQGANGEETTNKIRAYEVRRGDWLLGPSNRAKMKPGPTGTVLSLPWMYLKRE